MSGDGATRIHRAWERILADEQLRRPGMTGQDARKLVHQACLGGDHLLRDPAAFSKVFLGEWDRIDAHRDEGNALQLIHPSGTVARLHLGPCKAMGLSRRTVLDLLLAQPLKCADRSAFDWAWATILQSARRGGLPFSYDTLSAVSLDGEVTHHSPSYGPTSYRILNDLRDRATMEALCRLGLHR